MSDNPTPRTMRLGFVSVSWKGPKVPCAKCGRRVRSGTCHFDHRFDNPPPKVLCHWCVRDIMAAGSPASLN